MGRTLVVGGTGHLGRELVKAARRRGDEVHVLVRPSTAADAEKMSRLRASDVRVHEGDLADRESLVKACRAVDNVVSAVGSLEVAGQEPLIQAVREAGVARFIPSDFGLDPAATGPGSSVVFDLKAGVHAAVKRAGVPYTFIHSNGFFTHWVFTLGDLTRLGGALPPEEVNVYGSGDVPGAFASEADIAAVTVRALNDAAMENQELRIAVNALSQRQIITAWERVSGRTVKRATVSAADVEATIAAATAPEQGMIRVLAELHRSVWIRGEATRPGPKAISATEAYPDVRFRTIEEGLRTLL